MDIKIVICFILICLIPPASAADSLLTAESSGSIGLNDPISFENNFVKAISNTIESGNVIEKTQQENSETTKPLNVAPTDLVLFMILSYIMIAGVILSAALIAYSVAEVLR